MTVNTDLDGRLIGVLRSATSTPGLEYERRPEPMQGGFWAELFSFSLANPPDGWPAELVARLMPDPDSARKETIVQRAVAGAGFPTPFVRAAGGPDCGLGRAFMIMDRAAGGLALSGLDGVVTPAAVPRLLRRVPEVLAGSMARLHALDPDLVRGELEQVREVPVSVAGLLSMLARFAAEFGRPDLVSAARWLTDHPPAPAPDVICHGDLHPFNLLADGDQVTVLDWSTALLAPRAHDVAFTSLLLSEPPLRVPGWERPLIRVVGGELARRFVRSYQRQTAAAPPQSGRTIRCPATHLDRYKRSFSLQAASSTNGGQGAHAATGRGVTDRRRQEVRVLAGGQVAMCSSIRRAKPTRLVACVGPRSAA